jgi:phosphatidylglycerol:prolipoprotein diacylglycerol transferase
MHAKLLELGPLTIHTYGALLGVAFGLALWLAMRRAKEQGLDPGKIMELLSYVVLSAILGAQLLLLVTDFDTFRKGWRELLTLARSGGVFYGGLIAGTAVAIWYIRRNGLPLWKTLDVLAPSIALGHVAGRVGCLCAGCCFGKPTDVPWGVTFTDPHVGQTLGTPLHVPLHPTQLYEAGAELLILGVLLASERAERRRFPGRTFLLYIALYAISRFVIEFFRGDQRGQVGVLSTSQFISVLLAPLALIMLFHLYRRVAGSAAALPRASAR